MMSRRQVRRGLAAAARWGLLGVLLAGCGSVVASTGPPTPGASTPTGAGAATASPAPATAAPLVGCASVNQATTVTVAPITRLELLPDIPLMVTNRNPAEVRALFRDFCDAVAHPYPKSAVIHCPAGFGANYAGVLYDGSRLLARFDYAAGGCRRVSITVGSTTQSTMVAGPAATAAPHLAADFAAVLNAARPTGRPSASHVNPDGPKPSA